MVLEWFNSREAASLGIALADQYSSGDVAAILEKADLEVRGLRLNFYKRAKLANSFKWRLLENGIDRNKADDVTQQLVLHLSMGRFAAPAEPMNSGSKRPPSRNSKDLLAQANQHMARGEYLEAVETYRDLIKIDPRHAVALNNLGAALSEIGRSREAEGYFFQAAKVKPGYPDAHSNIGNALLLKGQYAAAESHLRHALKLNPRLVQARVNLGLALSFLSHLRDARAQLEKALKHAPGNPDALAGLALIAMSEGNFEQSGTFLDAALRGRPRMPRALALRAGLRKMTASDSAWLSSAEDVAENTIAPLDEAELRFAIAKYHDDVGNFSLAFQNYERANELLKSVADPYEPEKYQNFVDAMIRTVTRDAIAHVSDGASSSTKPVFVVGMPRSGTSLAEQIISSHPSAKGAGEMAFWADAVYEYETRMKTGFDASIRKKLAEAYLRVLEEKTGDALRIVDKAPVNSDYLGLIHSIFPNARFIYMDRDPIDTCLSCYFQKFVLSLNFTMDLSDLADYYRQHRRLMAHWSAVLPPGTLLNVPYEELVADQEGWSRKILEFLGLEWDEGVLNFHETKRQVVTASFWQVRQRIYKNSVERWRNYEKFIGPLRDLKRVRR